MDFLLDNIFNGNVLFWFFCVLTICGALYVLFSKNVLYASFGLLVSLLSVAGIFVFSGAEFIAAAQIMIYVGGILVLLIFGIMLSSSKELKTYSIEVRNDSTFYTSIILIVLILGFVMLSSSVIFSTNTLNSKPTIKKLGFNLMTESVLSLEIIGLLLLIALIGSTFIAKKNE